MRFLFLFILLAGFGLTGYGWYAGNVIGRDFARYHVYSEKTGPLPAHVQLTEKDGPLRVVAELGTAGAGDPSPDRALVTMTVASAGRTLLARAMTFAGIVPRDTDIQHRERVFIDSAGVIPEIAPGEYVFSVDRGDSDIDITYVDVILHREGAAFDPRLRPVGYGLIALGFLGLVFSLGRGGDRPQNPNSQPPPPRWGRGGADA